jgi:hypothetical protein
MVPVRNSVVDRVAGEPNAMERHGRVNPCCTRYLILTPTPDMYQWTSGRQ